MDMKKKLLALILALAMTAGLLAGCAGSASSSAAAGSAAQSTAQSSTSAASSDEKITLKFLNKYPEDEYVTYFEEAVKDYEAAHPNVTIDMENVSDEAIKDKLSVMAAGGEMPDIFFSWSGEYVKKFARSGLALDLTSYLDAESEWKNGFLPAFLNNSTFSGKTYGIPYRSSLIFLCYNKALFQKYSIAEPKTWDEFLAACQTLKDNGVTPIGFGDSATWWNAWWIGQLNAMLVDPDTLTADYNPETGKFTDPAYVTAIQTLLDLNTKGFFPNNLNSTDYYQIREEFIAGKYGMIMDGTSQFSIYEEGMGDDFGFCKWPVMENAAGDQGAITGGAEVYCVSSKCAHPEAAVDFIKFMTSLDQAKKQTSEVGLPNALVGGITADNSSANLVAAYKLAESYTNIADWLDTAIDGTVASQYMSSMQEGFAGTKTAAQIMADVQAAAAKAAG